MRQPRNLRPEPVELPLVTNRGDGLDRAERRLLREAVLALSGGSAPTVADLARATGLSSDRVRDMLRTLEARDCVAMEDDRVRLAYPFTTDDVAHEVLSSRGVARTCCAIDALGVGVMLGENVEVRSRCAYCGAPIRLRGRDRFEGSEGGVVVFLPPADRLQGKAIDAVCPSMNFYCDRDHGRAHAGPWADRGRFVSLAEATDLGVAIFGNLLRFPEGTAVAGADAVHDQVRERYASAAVTGRGCGCDSSCCTADYSAEELAQIPAESNLGLGSGNPVRHAALKPGEVVVDLGSGGGIDVFLAAGQVGPAGKVIGVDMTEEMLVRAQAAAGRASRTNVEFRQGLIENLPLEDATADAVLSNCVINLSPDKAAVFREAYRVLKAGGRLVISDVVQERPLGSIEDDCGCVATAMVRYEYLETIRTGGFRELTIIEDRPWRIGLHGVEASAITLRASKPRQEATQ